MEEAMKERKICFPQSFSFFVKSKYRCTSTHLSILRTFGICYFVSPEPLGGGVFIFACVSQEVYQ